MRVSVAQVYPKLGDVEANIEKTVAFVKEAIREKSSLCIFPELSLTGYTLQDLTFEVAMTREDERLIPLLELSREIGIIVGLIEETEENLFFNSAFYMKDGKIVHVHRKVYLPTYGMFDEARFTGAGNKVETFSSPVGKGCILICEDLWHFSTVYLAFIQGAKHIFALSASPGRGYREEGMFGNAEVWMNMGEFYSRMTGSYFFFVNRVGTEDGFVFSGKSFVADPYGNIVAEGSPFEEELITVEIKESLIRSARINLPLLRDEKPEMVMNNLRRILG
ncbi:nitrilase-related carbon-nitrogen hydrolase [Phorcysia thermohydrogeniphila]|uniref:Putative amidohydrolase n=1 Tax=Phorcysia thermohydrogeniphila TaxID=936138 RepID=A0A4R1GC68_9BACT|nr:nitrilase-related carbon-nitrogen hydrolase [Phorcysia thermohydrogeniphila]TCK05428.1 putative amidohydrolase [Phorcysia thermohydrogeniphila]